MAGSVLLAVGAVTPALPTAEPALEDEGPSEDFAPDLPETPSTDQPQPSDAGQADLLQLMLEEWSGLTAAVHHPDPAAPEQQGPDGAPGEKARSPQIASADLPEAPLLAAMAGEAPRPERSAGEADATAPKRPLLPGHEDDPGAPLLRIELSLPDAAAAIARDPGPVEPAHGLVAQLQDRIMMPAEARPVRHEALSIARQIAEAMVTARDDMIEIALAPEELGRIRMVLTGTEHSPHVTVWAERPEVLDQLRRNATILQECLADAGMGEASVDFRDDRRSGSGDAWAPQENAFDAARPETAGRVEIEALSWSPMVIPTRLDIRI